MAVIVVLEGVCANVLEDGLDLLLERSLLFDGLAVESVLVVGVGRGGLGEGGGGVLGGGGVVVVARHVDDGGKWEL